MGSDWIFVLPATLAPRLDRTSAGTCLFSEEADAVTHQTAQTHLPSGSLPESALNLNPVAA
jgi:hypothetical protein